MTSTMTPAVKEALESTNLELVKKIRGSEKGMLTKNINALKLALVKKADDPSLFDLEKISRKRVELIANEAKNHYEN